MDGKIRSGALDAYFPTPLPAVLGRERCRGPRHWIATTGCSRVATHFNVDTIDSNEVCNDDVLNVRSAP